MTQFVTIDLRAVALEASRCPWGCSCARLKIMPHDLNRFRSSAIEYFAVKAEDLVECAVPPVHSGATAATLTEYAARIIHVGDAMGIGGVVAGFSGVVGLSSVYEAAAVKAAAIGLHYEVSKPSAAEVEMEANDFFVSARLYSIYKHWNVRGVDETDLAHMAQVRSLQLTAHAEYAAEAPMRLKDAFKRVRKKIAIGDFGGRLGPSREGEPQDANWVMFWFPADIAKKIIAKIDEGQDWQAAFSAVEASAAMGQRPKNGSRTLALQLVIDYAHVAGEPSWTNHEKLKGRTVDFIEECLGATGVPPNSRGISANAIKLALSRYTTLKLTTA